MAKPEKEIPIHIDKTQYKVPAGSMTGSELRALPDPDLSSDYDLFEVVPGGDDRLIADGDAVELKAGMHFFSAPRNITPGR
jgi:Multiubiquitin